MLSHFLIFWTVGHAITVEKITLVPHQSQVFVGNIRIAFNSTTESTLVIWDRILADITFNPDGNEFLLIYANETNGAGRFEVFGQKLKPTGKRSGKPVLISPATDKGRISTILLHKSFMIPKRKANERTRRFQMNQLPLFY